MVSLFISWEQYGAEVWIQFPPSWVGWKEQRLCDNGHEMTCCKGRRRQITIYCPAGTTERLRFTLHTLITISNKLFTRTCLGLEGIWGLAPPSRVDWHDAYHVVGEGLERQHSAGGAVHIGLEEKVTWLCPQDVAGCPGGLRELDGDAVAVFGVGL